MNGNLQNKLQIMKKLLFTLFTLSIVLVQFGQGIKFDDNIYSKLEGWETNELGFSQTLPTSYSLRKYCPKPGNQGDAGSCVGWANAYAAMSIIYNIKFGLDSAITKRTQLAFDPNFIYSLIYLEDENDCSVGTHSSMALDTLHHYGCKRKILPKITKCNSKIGNKSKYFARGFKISNFYSVPPDFFNNSVDLTDKVNMLKEKIAENNPLVIGASTFGSIDDVGLKSSGLWDSYSNETNQGGHAMCVVGYDDTKFGGAFEVMNSWGDDWGDDGFLWIKYDDFVRKVNRVFLIETYETTPNKIQGKGTCYLGDCKNEYSFIKYDENSFYEGEFRNGNFDGYGIYRERDGIEYIGRWNYGKKDGQFLVYNSNKDISYKITYNNNIKVDEEIHGFANSVKNDLMNDDFFKHLENNGLIKLGDSDDFDVK